MSANEMAGMAMGPDGVLLKFYYDSAPNTFASTQAGRAIFDTVLMVQIIAPGQNASTPHVELERVWSEESIKALDLKSPVKRSASYMLYEEQIERFKRGTAQLELGGTPLKQWPRISQGLAATLVGANIHTVEQLANMPDSNLMEIGIGGRELRDQAKEFLAQAAGTSDVSKLVAENTTLKSENQRLQTELAMASQITSQLQAQVAKLTEAALPPPPPPVPAEKMQDPLAM